MKFSALAVGQYGYKALLTIVTEAETPQCVKIFAAVKTV